jgi:hypothetical protein
LPDEQTRHAFLTNIPAHRTLMGDHHKAGAGPA